MPNVAVSSQVSGAVWASGTLTLSSVVVGAGQTLVVRCGWRDQGSITLSSITWGATNLTILPNNNNGAYPTLYSGKVNDGFYGIGLTPGTQTVTLTLSSASVGLLAAAATVLDNVDQVTPFGTPVVNVPTAGVATNTVATIVGGMALDWWGVCDGQTNNIDGRTADSPQANVFDLQITNNGHLLYGSTKAATTTSTTMSWTSTINSADSFSIGSILPVNPTIYSIVSAQFGAFPKSFVRPIS